MPKTVYAKSNNTKTTKSVAMPLKNDGTQDKRYSNKQFTNSSNGKRDMRTKNISNK
mgnify:CR=1 FL=1|jgi:hypothetical protein|tara:strand:- start:7603 stop:7770 length:168 start_codon:yes stop_codon:yes gene_type:complete